MRIPTLDEVLNSTTDERYRHRNWAKHRNDSRFRDSGFPFESDFAPLDGFPFTRKAVFDAFRQSAHKGIVAAIKWGYPRGSLPGGRWRAFSTAFRTEAYAVSVERFLQTIVRSRVALTHLNGVISGIGTATTTKMMYFGGLSVDTGDGEPIPSLIYDSMVRRAIVVSSEAAFDELRCKLRRWKSDIPPNYQEQTYEEYLRAVTALARHYGVRGDQIELALFRKGRSLPRRGARSSS